MTPDEIRIIAALARCSFAPGTSQKRFVRQMAARVSMHPLTDRQRANLWAIAWSWRRQLPRELADLAKRYSGGLGSRGGEVNGQRYREHIKRVTQAVVACLSEGCVDASNILPSPPADERQGVLFG